MVASDLMATHFLQRLEGEKGARFCGFASYAASRETNSKFKITEVRAAVRTKYGLPGDLAIREMDIPVPKEDEVLIRVHASTVNRSDCHVLSGKPFAMRLFTGLLKPRAQIIGSDFTGTIETVGNQVSSFKPGEKIMGFGGGFGCGAHAQYFILPEKRALKMITALPQNLSYKQAAACLEGCFYGLNSVMMLNPQPGQRTLVIGATGAIGSAMVQYLKYYGLHVTAVCGRENEALVKSLGADRIIDLHTADFTKEDATYDLIFDAVGKSSFMKCKHLLVKKGIYTSSGGAINLLLVLVTPLFGGKKVVFRSAIRIRAGLEFIKELVETGRFKPVIDRTNTLEKIAEAYTYVASGQKIGNVIIDMDAEN